MYNKYHAKKIKNEYGVFDSKKEFKRFLELKELEKAGKIEDLRRQVSFTLLSSQKGDLRTERPVKYNADFVYFLDGKQVVEDTKGVKTKDYIIKRKLMKYIHDIEVVEK